MPIIFWVLLIVIGVFDAREYRIPNYLLILLFSLSCVYFYFISNTSEENYLLQHIYGFVIAFGVGIIFYLFNSIAAGDVKFAGVIGFIVGYGGLLSLAQYLSISYFFVGSLYWILNRLRSNSRVSSKGDDSYFYSSNFIAVFKSETHQIKSNFQTGINLTYMPFAPVLIIALAMYQYFQY
ncbi:A24 family peptidase [Vibrio diazotrophicus]|uniref:A24 family peptidase n=1 Tax=Vibrio diazotrophicus TaxID=685 RepID=UPI000C9E1D9A|nr:A24 family peptidase [Vibrio diazotrophicus]PNH81636.1 hypothetical protein C1N27_05970 [Vibrio diazotrophicus]